MIPWLVLAIVGILCDIVYFFIILNVGVREHIIIEAISYMFGIGNVIFTYIFLIPNNSIYNYLFNLALQLFIFRHIYFLYKDIRFKTNIQQEHEIIWRKNNQHQQQLMENF